jgi:hypothetical protein
MRNRTEDHKEKEAKRPFGWLRFEEASGAAAYFLGTPHAREKNRTKNREERKREDLSAR